MKILLQRVKKAFVSADGFAQREIGHGMLLLIGVEERDNETLVAEAAKKIPRMRIFEDDSGKMNLDVLDSGGRILSVPQFTLCSNMQKGNRPSFDRAAKPEKAKRLWELLNSDLAKVCSKIEKGFFGKSMEVGIINDGPVTFYLEF